MSHIFLQNIFNEDNLTSQKPKLSPEEAERNRELEQAWKAYYSQRFCPPLALLAAQTDDVKLHMSVCPMCQRRFQELKEAEVELNDCATTRKKGTVSSFPTQQKEQDEVSKRPPTLSGFPFPFGAAACISPTAGLIGLLNFSKDRKSPTKIVKKGIIYKLSSQLEGFDEVYQYILAPQVLVLEVKQQAATVAVVSTALAFAESTNKNAVLPYHAFVETWNTFEMPLSLFSTQVLTLSDEEMQYVQRIGKESFRIINDDTWSESFMQNEEDLADIIKTRAHCLCVNKESAWNWKEACSDLLYKVKELFTPLSPVLQAASEGDRVDIHIQKSTGVELSHADVTLCNLEKGYMELHMHLPKGTVIEHAIVLAENEDGIVSGDADIDGNMCYVKFKENALHKDSVLTIILTTKD